MEAPLFIFAAILEVALIAACVTWGAQTYDPEELKSWDEAQR